MPSHCTCSTPRVVIGHPVEVQLYTYTCRLEAPEVQMLPYSGYAAVVPMLPTLEGFQYITHAVGSAGWE